MVDENVLGFDNNGKGSQDQPISNMEPKVQAETSKLSTDPSSNTSSIKRGNPFSKVGEVVDLIVMRMIIWEVTFHLQVEVTNLKIIFPMIMRLRYTTYRGN